MENSDTFQAAGRRRKQGEQSPESQPASLEVLLGPRPLVWTSGSERSRGEGSASTTWMVRARSEGPARASLGCTITNFTRGQDPQPQRHRHWRQCRLRVGGGWPQLCCAGRMFNSILGLESPGDSRFPSHVVTTKSASWHCKSGMKLSRVENVLGGRTGLPS